MPLTVFISHHSADRGEAERLCTALESQGYRCWIAPRDILPGRDWAEAIMEGIEQASVMVLLDSEKAASSCHVARELDLAASTGKRTVRVSMTGGDGSGGVDVRLEQVLRALPPPVSRKRWIGAAGVLGVVAGLLAALILVLPGRDTRRFPVESIRFVDVPGGSFLMGSPEGELGRWQGEGPQTDVQVEGFQMMTTEVTREMWTGVMGSTQEDLVLASGVELTPYVPESPSGDLPVVLVTWGEAVAFAEALGRLDTTHVYRLPTEAEWEYACRAGSTGPVYGTDGGQTIDDISWHLGSSGCRLHPVGLLAPNAWGLHDMLGNVSELCLDGWRDDLSSMPASASDTLPGRIGFRTQRGGSYINSSRLHRCAFRDMFREDMVNHAIGFRVVRFSR